MFFLIIVLPYIAIIGCRIVRKKKVAKEFKSLFYLIVGGFESLYVAVLTIIVTMLLFSLVARVSLYFTIEIFRKVSDIVLQSDGVAILFLISFLIEFFNRVSIRFRKLHKILFPKKYNRAVNAVGIATAGILFFITVCKYYI